ncbi:MAG: CHAD domain-containing protein [Acidimicrobiia bacterium]|nr:CHAD domain-containing protein [Acidimicrobiia bacterium]
MSEFADQRAEDMFPPGPYMVMGAMEGLADALRRMALEQIEVMVAGFDEVADDAFLDHKVHLARKAGKRLRGLIRLCRPELGMDGYRHANDLVRDQARLLSAIRTSNVLLKTLDGLVEDNSMSTEGMRELRGLLVQRHDAMLDGLRADSAGRAAAQRVLTELFDCVEVFPSPETYGEQDLGAVANVIESGYRSARKAMRKADRSGSAHDFHEWRKGVNYLRYQLEALRGACGPPIAVLVVELDELSEIVGEDHDLADLLEISHTASLSVPDGLPALVEERSRNLRATALDRGGKAFANKPKEFKRFFTENSR